MAEKVRTVYVVGHKNPDTDSICSAIAYANLKTLITGQEHKAKRAGQINEETQYVLRRFGATLPSLLSTVATQVQDLDINRLEGITSNASIKEAWELMKENNMKTMPITRDGILEGLISTGDITASYMDVYDSHILANARTQYRNIIRTLEGNIVAGNEHSYFLNGKVVIAASSPEKMEEFIEKDDLVILGNRYEMQLCAIELGVRCIILCQDAPVSKTIFRMAEEKSIVIIQTPHDVFTVARLINQSIPVKYFMSNGDLTSFSMNEFVNDIKDIMAKKRYRDFPVLDKKGRYVGLISRRRLMDVSKKQVILVDHNEKSQAVNGIEEAEVLEIIDHHRLGTMETIGPVYFRNQPVGCTATIITEMYKEAGIKIDKMLAGLLCSAILSDTLMFRSPTCTPMDQKAAEKLAKIAEVDIANLADEMFHAGSNMRNKTPKEICFQDFKKFEVGGTRFGVGQISLMNQIELEEIREKISDYLNIARVDQDLHMVFFMLTNIFEEYTELLCCGEGAKEQIIEAFDLPEDTDDIVLRGVVSRKKQLIPNFVISLQQ
ncbi:MAG: putative manganese-dependent inorganic diphosphatase [Eubacteriales bacterium]